MRKFTVACLVATFCLVVLLSGCAPQKTQSPVSSSECVPILFFSSETCGECREVAAYLDQLTASGTPLEVHRYSFEDLTSASLRHSLDLLYNVPEEDWYVVPAYLDRLVTSGASLKTC